MKIHPMRLLVNTLNQEQDKNETPWEYSCYSKPYTIIKQQPPQHPCLPLSLLEKFFKMLDYSNIHFYDDIATIQGDTLIVKDKIYGLLIEKTLKKLNLEFIVELQ